MAVGHVTQVHRAAVTRVGSRTWPAWASLTGTFRSNRTSSGSTRPSARGGSLRFRCGSSCPTVQIPQCASAGSKHPATCCRRSRRGPCHAVGRVLACGRGFRRSSLPADGNGREFQPSWRRFRTARGSRRHLAPQGSGQAPPTSRRRFWRRSQGRWPQLDAASRPLRPPPRPSHSPSPTPPPGRRRQSLPRLRKPWPRPDRPGLRADWQQRPAQLERGRLQQGPC
jgi:hypothetical protein